MQIKLSSIYASPHRTAHPGSIIDVSDEEGAELIAGNYAVAVGETAPAVAQSSNSGESLVIETAALAPAPNAALPKPSAKAKPAKASKPAKGKAAPAPAPEAPAS